MSSRRSISRRVHAGAGPNSWGEQERIRPDVHLLLDSQGSGIPAPPSNRTTWAFSTPIAWSAKPAVQVIIELHRLAANAIDRGRPILDAIAAFARALANATVRVIDAGVDRVRRCRRRHGAGDKGIDRPGCARGERPSECDRRRDLRCGRARSDKLSTRSPTASDPTKKVRPRPPIRPLCASLQPPHQVNRPPTTPLVQRRPATRPRCSVQNGSQTASADAQNETGGVVESVETTGIRSTPKTTPPIRAGAEGESDRRNGHRRRDQRRNGSPTSDERPGSEGVEADVDRDSDESAV